MRKALTIIFSIIAFTFFVGWIWGFSPFERILENLTPQKIKSDVDSKVNFFSVIMWGVFAGISRYIKKFIEGMYSKERCERMLEAEKDRLMKKMSDRTELNKTA